MKKEEVCAHEDIDLVKEVKADGALPVNNVLMRRADQNKHQRQRKAQIGGNHPGVADHRLEGDIEHKCSAGARAQSICGLRAAVRLLGLIGALCARSGWRFSQRDDSSLLCVLPPCSCQPRRPPQRPRHSAGTFARSFWSVVFKC